jgi:hypothetical protein
MLSLPTFKDKVNNLKKLKQHFQSQSQLRETQTTLKFQCGILILSPIFGNILCRIFSIGPQNHRYGHLALFINE